MTCLFSGKAAMPFSLDVKKPLGIGMSFDIAGDTGKPGITISLSSDLNLTQDACLSIAARPSKHVIALNSMKHGVWGKEQIQKWENMFNPGFGFKIRIKAMAESYEILDTSGRDDVPIGTYNYRQDISETDCTYLVFKSDGATITSVTMNE